MGIDLEQPSEEHQRDREDNGENVIVNMALSPHKNLEPHDGMEFDSKEDAFSFYKEYAKSVGFATIIKASRRSRISGKFIDAKFVCTRYGSKRESNTSETLESITNEDGTTSIAVKRKRGRVNRSSSKTDCKAGMHVKRGQDGGWIIRNFIKEHNHEIFLDQAYYFKGHQKIDLGNNNNNTDALHAIRARTKKMFVTLSRQSVGMKKTQNEKTGTRNTSGQHVPIDEGDSQVMLEHFMHMQDENPNFFYAIDLNPEQSLRNVLWVDAKSRLDYKNFSDVVFFDVSYIKNEYKLPFAPFIGVNHHFQVMLLGCALISDESKSTFAWAMRAWLRAMGGQAPKVILTDQDMTLKEAVAEVFPQSRHCFCLWHILSKVQEKLSYAMRQHDKFIGKFNKCVLKCGTYEQFEKGWQKMVDRFDLRNDLWLQTLYEDRERWVPTYMRNVFLGGMSTVQRSESINSLFDKCIQRKTTLKDFLEQYKAILREKHEEEAREDFETWHKQPGLKSPSPFGKQMATMYTHAIFKKFQVEVLGVVACHPKRENKDGAAITFRVQDFEENLDFIVAWNEITSDISCSCRLFEYNGFLCRHVMIVLQMSGVHEIPSQYVLQRWTKIATGFGVKSQPTKTCEYERVRKHNTRVHFDALVPYLRIGGKQKTSVLALALLSSTTFFTLSSTSILHVHCEQFSWKRNKKRFSMGIDLEQPSEEHQRDREDNGENVIVNMALSPHKNLEPHDGMEFDSKEDAFSFYKEYAKSVGFATIIKASRRSRISGKFIDAKFVCTRYGSKRESNTSETLESITNEDGTTSIAVKRKRGRVNRSSSKTDCKAGMHVKRGQDGGWIIRNFIKEHNHEIFLDQAYYFKGHQKIDLGNNNNNTDALHAIRARTKKMFVTLSRQSVGMKKTQNEKTGTRNTSGQHVPIDEGDSQVMLEHFMHMQDENPNFFYAIDLNPEQSLRNVLWVDAKSRLDYKNFSDVVFFDVSYIKNEYKLPFAPFIGVNHHFQVMLLGCALISDESKSTFAWAMRAWLRAMGGQAPKVILTDQDMTLKEAVAEVFPQSRHCFCLWHILSKVQEKLSYAMRQHDKFIGKFNKCVLKCGTYEQFEKGWQKMVDRFDLRNDLWLQTLYEDRERWVPTYMRNVFLGGMSTVQRSESINSLFDKCIQRKTTLKDFLEQYKAILREKHEEEAREDFETWHKQPGLKSPSPFGKQMATMYTHAIFKKFQVEVLGVVACHPKRENKDGAAITFRVQDFEENLDFIVAWNEITSDISCSCRLFEYNGFLCRHVMIVLQMSGVHEIPSQYVLQRWTKDAKSRRMMGQIDVADSRVQRYKNLCQRAFKLGDEGSLCQESYNIALNVLKEALRKCEGVNDSMQNVLGQDFEGMTQNNCTSKTNKKNIMPNKEKVLPEPEELITITMHDNWQQVGHSNLREPALDCSYELPESIQGTEQLNSRVSSLDGYFGTQPIVQGMGQLNTIASGRGDYYSNQQNMQGLGQLNSIAPIHDGHYLPQQRLHDLGHLHFGPQTIPSCFHMQDSSPEQSNVEPTSLHGMASKHLQSKHLPR